MNNFHAAGIHPKFVEHNKHDKSIESLQCVLYNGAIAITALQR